MLNKIICLSVFSVRTAGVEVLRHRKRGFTEQNELTRLFMISVYLYLSKIFFKAALKQVHEMFVNYLLLQ